VNCLQKKTDIEELITPPAYVVQRQSTDIAAIEDPDVAEAISYITKNVGRTTSVEDVLREVMVPRRTLERRFHKLVGNSIYKEIQNERIKRIERLLIETNMTVAEIAYSMGYSNPNELTRSFSSNRKMSPTFFRKKYKTGLLRDRT